VIDDLTLPQVDELYRYWAKQPPTHVLVAAYLGIKPQGKTRVPTDADISELIGFFGKQAQWETGS
jgi:hypothetical protein